MGLQWPGKASDQGFKKNMESETALALFGPGQLLGSGLLRAPSRPSGYEANQPGAWRTDHAPAHAPAPRVRAQLLISFWPDGCDFAQAEPVILSEGMFRAQSEAPMGCHKAS